MLGDSPPKLFKPAPVRDSATTWASGPIGFATFSERIQALAVAAAGLETDLQTYVRTIPGARLRQIWMRAGVVVTQVLDPRALSTTYGARSDDLTVDEEKERFEQINARRRYLIEKEYVEGRLSEREGEELERLQNEIVQSLRALRPERGQAIDALRRRAAELGIDPDG
jgi:hypothetical protein